MKKLFLLDAFALIYRAYFAFGKNHRYSSKGLNTSTALGFTNTLLEVLEKENPTHIAVVFDSPSTTIRVQDYADYKANRSEMPEDIRLALPYVKSIIEGFNISQVFLDGYEADDLVGTIAKVAEKEGFTTYMMTPDKDFGQLVTEKTIMYKPAKGGNKPELLGVKEVCEKFGVKRTSQVIDILGLWGDAVDNIPGIPGIGEKTAKKLIAKYDSLENLIENAHQLQGKQKENVINFANQGLLSKKLATIIVDAPLVFNLEDFKIKEKSEEVLIPLFEELELRNLAQRIFNKTIRVGATTQPSQLSLFNSDEEELAPDNNLITHNELKTDYRLLSTLEEIEELKTQLLAVTSFAFDTETTGLDTISVDLVGLSICFKKHQSFYISFNSFSFDKIRSTLAILQPVFSNSKILKIGHNLKYDLNILKRFGLGIAGPFFDTMITHFIVAPHLRSNMDYLAQLYLNYKTIPISEIIGEKGKGQKNMADIPAIEVLNYACEDADITFQLKQILENKIDVDLSGLLKEVEFPLIDTLSEMELNGIKLDIEFLNEFSKDLNKDLVEIKCIIFKQSESEFNIDSPKQLGEVLFEKLQITEKPKKTKTGQYSTNEMELVKLKDKHPIVKEILNYRTLKKLKSTYVDALPKLVNAKTKRLHSTFMQAVAATGRLSSVNPNIQNIPIKTSRGREVRKAFVSTSEKYTLLAADYSQIELRIIAALSEDENMKSAFRDNRDIHIETAAKVFNLPVSDVTKGQRAQAKAVNFGIIYGVSAFGLAQNIGIKRTEAKILIDNYFNQYPRIKLYMDGNIAFAKKHGYVETIMKRRRSLVDINSNNPVVRGHAERNAINSPIQGSAADIIKLAMINIHKIFRDKKLTSKMVMQVHDELVFDVLLSELEEVKQIVKQNMENAVKLDVPLDVEMNHANNWLLAH